MLRSLGNILSNNKPLFTRSTNRSVEAKYHKLEGSVLERSTEKRFANIFKSHARLILFSLSSVRVKELCTLYGAKSVRYLGETGKMKHSAFATFASPALAKQGLIQLHQLSILGHMLRVEYASTKLATLAPVSNRCDADSTINKHQQSKKSHIASHDEKPLPLKSKLNYISAAWNIPYDIDNQTYYSYPIPTDTTLQNIVHCMASVPKFYVQVLHLMNKMSLPPPFGELTTKPPVCKSDEKECTTVTSSEESEMESSDNNEDDKPVSKSKKDHPVGRKRTRPVTGTELYAKRLRSQLNLPQHSSSQSLAPSNKPKAVAIQDVFEVAREQAKQVQISLSTQSLDMPSATPPEGLSSSEMHDSFGKITKPKKSSQVQEIVESVSAVVEVIESKEPLSTTTPYITSKELRNGLLPKEELNDHPLLKKYSPGDPTSRLYIKNLAKQTTLEELKYIFGRYVDWNSESDADIFNIRHMTEGRMKGQAFVTLPSIDAAQAAVTECHTYRLNGRPMIVAFGKANT